MSREEWRRSFNNGRIVVLTVDASCWNTSSEEKVHRNKIEESLTAFDRICSVVAHVDPAIVLVFTHCDLISSELRRVPGSFNKLFPDLIGEASESSVLAYLKIMFEKPYHTYQTFGGRLKAKLLVKFTGITEDCTSIARTVFDEDFVKLLDRFPISPSPSQVT